LRSITESPPAAVWSATDIYCVKPKPPTSGGLHTTYRCDIVLRTGKCGGWENALGDQTTFAINIGEHSLQQLGALRNPCSDSAPLLLGEE